MKKKSHTKDQAIVIGQALVHGKWLECAYKNNQVGTFPSYYYSNSKPEQNQVFYDDNSFYRPGPTALNCHRNENVLLEKKKAMQESEEGPEWIKELNELVSNLDDESNVSGEKLSQSGINSEDLDEKSQTSSDAKSMGENESKSNENFSVPLVKSKNSGFFFALEI